MKTLLLMRHAKAESGSSSGLDLDRGLAPRGLKAARRMGQLLAGQKPDLMLVSPAMRTRKTAELAHAAGEFTCPLKLVADLYEATPDRALAAIAREAGSASQLLVVGHEPTTSELVALLTGSQVKMVTGAVAGIELHFADWSALARPPVAGRPIGILLFLAPPRLIEPAG